MNTTQLPHPDDVIKTPKHHPITVKPITLTLEYYVKVYKVTAITNSTYYRPGEWMSPEVAQACCDTDGWTVNMVDNQIIQSFLNFGLSKAQGLIP